MMWTSGTKRDEACRVRAATLLGFAGLVAMLAPIGSAEAATFEQIGTGKIVYPSVGGFPATQPGPDGLLFVNDGCDVSQWDGKFAVAINVEAYQDRTLEFRFKSADQVIDTTAMRISPYRLCATTAANGDPRDNYIGEFYGARVRMKIKPTTMWLLVTPTGTASGIVFTVHKCISGC